VSKYKYELDYTVDNNVVSKATLNSEEVVPFDKLQDYCKEHATIWGLLPDRVDLVRVVVRSAKDRGCHQ
jgi:hypothetical protein